MGLIFNTKKTTKMLAAVNDAFDDGSISTLRTSPGSGQPAPMEYFNASSSHKVPLWKAAINLGIFGDGVQGSPIDKKFQKWLKGLDKVGIGDTVCAQIYQGLIDPNCAELYFVLVPASNISVAPNPPAVGTANAYTLVITISTVDITKVPTFIKMYEKVLATRRAANTRAIRKKAAKKKSGARR